MGAPIRLAMAAQATAAVAHFAHARNMLQDYAFEEQRGKTRIMREPIGVCGLIRRVRSSR